MYEFKFHKKVIDGALRYAQGFSILSSQKQAHSFSFVACVLVWFSVLALPNPCRGGGFPSPFFPALVLNSLNRTSILNCILTSVLFPGASFRSPVVHSASQHPVSGARHPVALRDGRRPPGSPRASRSQGLGRRRREIFHKECNFPMSWVMTKSKMYCPTFLNGHEH